MKLRLYKYQGAGNDFLIADNRDGSISLTSEKINFLCDRRYGIGADGLMLLEEASSRDVSEYGQSLGFRMVYYNSDGSGGMMCGNGGRCIVAFAADKGISNLDFIAADGLHKGEVLSALGNSKVVKLLMKDVKSYSAYKCLTGVEIPSEGVFLDTGTRHYVRFVRNLDGYDVVGEGRDIRYNAEELQPIGANVNFVEPCDGILKVRTYEKGVEDETFACGTGIVASCIAAYRCGISPAECSGDSVRYDVAAKRDRLSVSFIPKEGEDSVADNVYLTGPATFVAEIIVDE